ncbi:X-box-binding protein 1 isoform 1 [Tropilaelaps mercedesae]|uniref:X-box-binding protein 1 n=1 Tax=Tropilaelaps mercedesae TaxID=418985 RepID=A0A1V9X1R2_9ACAR|nr:X-box-binding protein 1 isoform 1 [Tropilaelaps mercedesae]
MDVLDSAVRTSGLDTIEQKVCRKRQRLDHLSPEEKLLRRKMKNRAAAQSARDRKKAHMDELEVEVHKLRQDKRRLAAENERLREAMALQQKQMDELRRRLATTEAETPIGSVAGDEIRSGPAEETNLRRDDDHLADEPEEQHLSLFDDKDLVALLLNQPSADSDSVGASPPTIEVESAPLENLDHVYHKPLHRDAEAALGAHEPVAVTQQLPVPLSDLTTDTRPSSSSSVSTCPRSPFSTSSSSGYDSDYKDSDKMAWEESFSDLFPDLV